MNIIDFIPYGKENAITRDRKGGLIWSALTMQ